MSKILNHHQAEAIHQALKMMETIHMRGCDMRFTKAIVTCDSNGTIRVISTALVDDERYTDLATFAKSYSLKA